ncbi:LysE family translocator [Methylopila henanensis]|uniref:LysE family translocator n=1 Tax=Methylopila henanensis TaxID=873516 RepID=A0ABW4K9B3_9HYPH
MSGAELDGLLAVYGLYLVATASPGPSNMTIMATAMTLGRRAAFAVAAGVLTGSLCWATLAALGVSSLLAAYAEALFALKIAGGLYLLWLAAKSARAALRSEPPPPQPSDRRATLTGLYRRGLALHLTNPKSILAWISIMSLGLGAHASPATPFVIVAGCFALGVLVFGGYAALFSTAPMAAGYRRARRAIEAGLAAFFAFAGFRLLTSRL